MGRTVVIAFVVIFIVINYVQGQIKFQQDTEYLYSFNGIQHVEHVADIRVEAKVGLY